MMPQAEQYPFVAMDPALGAASLLPYLPITLAFRQLRASSIAPPRSTCYLLTLASNSEPSGMN